MQKESTTNQNITPSFQEYNKSFCQYITSTGAICNINSIRNNSLCTYHHIQSDLNKQRKEFFNQEFYEAPEIKD